jgi:hypothetical protein
MVAVDDPDTIDIMSISPSGAVVLTIVDHLDWTDSTSHQYILQAKMNRYLAFIESGEILEHHPDADDRGVVIEVVTRCEPDADGWAFLDAGCHCRGGVRVQPPSLGGTSPVTPPNVH